MCGFSCMSVHNANIQIDLFLAIMLGHFEVRTVLNSIVFHAILINSHDLIGT